MTGPKRVTEKQLAANRANARKSTGPRTPEGKAISRHNALKHGILAQALIPEALALYESQDAFDELVTELLDIFKPINAIEELLIQQIAVAYWRLARLYRAEAADIAWRYHASDREEILMSSDHEVDWPPPLAAEKRLAFEHDALQAVLQGSPVELCSYLLTHYRGLDNVDDDTLLRAAQDHLTAVQQQYVDLRRHRLAIKDTRDSLPDPDTALTFARYETSLQNQLDRALARLEHLQRLRGAGYATPVHPHPLMPIEPPDDEP